jgi:hypothetical protein
LGLEFNIHAFHHFGSQPARNGTKGEVFAFAIPLAVFVGRPVGRDAWRKNPSSLHL